MLVFFWLLLILYAGLTLLYAVTDVVPTKITPWPVLSIDPPPDDPFEKTCENDADCGDHVCLGNRCVPKLLRDGSCDPATGRWTAHSYRGGTFAICVCSRPNLVNQKHFGGNCDVNVGCGVRGRYLPDENACECDPGYRAIGFSCRKIPAVEAIDSEPCDGPDEIRVSEIRDGFHADYVERLNASSLKCVKRPCSFDVLSGRPLERGAKFARGWGCVCDPRYGLFGVSLESDAKYLNAPGFDGCASIFSERDPREPMRVRLATYFYLGEREPVSVIAFDERSNDDDVVPALKGRFPLIVGQKLWNYDYSQYFFDTEPEFRARTRSVWSFPVFNIEKVNEWKYVDDFSIGSCDKIPDVWRNSINPRVDVYNLLYQNPVCRDQTFGGKVVVNPQHITFKRHANLFRANAFVLSYDGHRWTLDLDDYKIDVYRSVETNAPLYEVNVKSRTINTEGL